MVRKEREKRWGIRLRQKGYAYSEIARKLKVSKSSCSLWLRDIELNNAARARIEKLRVLAREKGHAVSRQNRERRDAEILAKARRSVSALSRDRGLKKALSACLYWSEGTKSGSYLTFMNSDPRMVRTFLSLLRDAFSISEAKFGATLHLHEYHDVPRQKAFWAHVTGIPVRRIGVYRKPNSGQRIREGYPGCISVRYYDVRLARELRFLYSALAKQFGRVG